MVEIDELDQGPAVFSIMGTLLVMPLKLADYSIPHGIAVAYGMDLSNFISRNLGMSIKSFVMK